MISVVDEIIFLPENCQCRLCGFPLFPVIVISSCSTSGVVIAIVNISNTRVASHLSLSDPPSISCIMAGLSRSDTPT